MFGADIMVAHFAGLFDGVFENKLSVWGKLDLIALEMSLAADTLDHLADALRLQTEFA